MAGKNFILFTVLYLALIIGSNNDLLAGSKIDGYVKDANTGEMLYGANVVLVGTSLGASSDIDGFYSISNVKAGSYVLRASYIGYNCPDIQITVGEDVHLVENFSLTAVSIEGDSVVVTAQASGQKQAINQQLTSDQIVSVVSSSRIQELPDANAAESVGRLPGVSVLRSGGEGYSVVVRGLAPKYNAVTIDGIKMSSSSSDDRSNDLSMISSDLLAGIQVSKTVTPDMDATVIGGSVNFEFKEASEGDNGKPIFSLRAEGGYNGLANASNDLNNFSYSGSIEDRFFDKKFGVILQVNADRKNLSSNEMGASYSHLGNSTEKYTTTDLNLYKVYRDKRRYNAALILDYKLTDGKIKLTNFISTGKTDAITRGEVFSISDNTRDFTLGNSSSKLSVITNGLNIQKEISIFDIDARLSHSYTEGKAPGWTADFLQSSAGLSDYSGVSDIDPKVIPAAAKTDISSTYLSTFENSQDFAKERAYSASIDLKTNVNISELISAQIKFGGKYEYQKKNYDYSLYDGTLSGGYGTLVNSTINSYFGLESSTTRVAMSDFLDKDYDYGEMFDGDYSMSYALSNPMLRETAQLLEDNIDYFADNGSNGGYGYDVVNSTTYDFSGNEKHSAFYLMSTIQVGQYLTVIPGVRFQQLKTTYTGNRGIIGSSSDYYNNYDTTVAKTHSYWLPDVSIKYKPLDWFDIRFSYTNTLAYPDYDAIIPRIQMYNNSIIWRNYDLKPSRSTNYDVSLSFYNNTVGLFTVSGFLKRIKDLIYDWTFYVSGNEVIPYLPGSLIDSYSSNSTYSIGTYVNNSYKIDDYGAEFDWQTHFWYLPEPLNGIVLNVNYTHIFSEAEYPYTYTKSTGRTVEYIDTSYTNRLLYQPDDIVNVSIGFDYKDFSTRVSMLYQTDIFTGPNFWPQLRSHTSSYRRWDISAKQTLPWYNIEVYGNVNNLNGAYDVSVIKGGGVPTSQEEYGLTANLGVKFEL